MKKTAVCLVTGLMLTLMGLTAQARERQCFDKDWRFLLGDSVIMAKADFDDSSWRQLDVPHDWAIEGDFFVGNPSGAGGGALPGGIGWYRKTFTLGDCETPMKDTKFFIEFDGVYMNSTVYVNGEKVGNRPYGYSSFEYDITPYVREGKNVVAVRVDNSDQPNSRWYSGCGIYRHVWLTKIHAGIQAVASIATSGSRRLPRLTSSTGVSLCRRRLTAGLLLRLILRTQRRPNSMSLIHSMTPMAKSLPEVQAKVQSSKFKVQS